MKKKIDLPAELCGDFIDSRDIIALREELEIDRLAMSEFGEEFPADDMALLALLRDICEEGEGCAPDWEYGETLIADHAFVEYARELAYDCGMVDSNASWPNFYIDWEAAARDLQMDYCGIEIGGVTYWIRG